MEINISEHRLERTMPDHYRLARKPNGELVLQGAYEWQQGYRGGYTWRDIPTVELTDTGVEK